jgi:hypothetical protein
MSHNFDNRLHLETRRGFNVNNNAMAVTSQAIEFTNTIKGSALSDIGLTQFTLPIGRWAIKAQQTIFVDGVAFLQLFNVTKDAIMAQGLSRNLLNGFNASQGLLTLDAEFETVDADDTFELRIITTSVPQPNGLGVAHNIADTDNIYATMQIIEVLD